MSLTTALIKPHEAHQATGDMIPIWITSEMPLSKNQTQNSMIEEAQKIVQSQRLTISDDARMIGNQRGFSLFQMMEDMNRKLDETRRELGETRRELGETTWQLGETRRELGETRRELGETTWELGETTRELGETKRDLSEQKSTNEDMKIEKYSDRVIELLNRSTQVHHFSRYRHERNARIHGANIELDLKVVGWLQKNGEPRVSAAKQGFQAMYGLPFEEASFLMAKAPMEITQSINNKSNLDLLDYYSSHWTPEIREMEQICTDILDLWKDSVRHGAAYLKEEVQVKRSEYERLHNMWEAKRCTGSNKKRNLDLHGSSGET